MSKRKEPPREGNVNQEFCDFLLEIAEYERNVNKNIYKYNAYRKAASSLARHPTRITNGKEARNLDGVGQKIAEKLDEFIETGELTKLKKIRKDDTGVAINNLTRVSGIGPSKARELVEQGIKSLEDLRKYADKLNHHQQIGLKYLEDFESKIPRAEIEQIETVMREEIAKLDDRYEITICGSYRRGKQESGDIDALITHPTYTSDKKSNASLLQDVVKALEVNGLITENIALGDVKFMGVCKIAERARRLDIRLTPYDQYYCSVLYFTGSDLFNQQMRAHAQSNGFTLNEYCLRRVGSTGAPGEPLPLSSEEDIFDYMDYPYRRPEERNL